MKDIDIPPAALEAGADEIIDTAECNERCERIRRSYEGTPCKCRETARAAFVAIVEAWPGVMDAAEDFTAMRLPFRSRILPLMENPDDKA